MDCTKCGKEMPELNEDGLCPDCAVADEATPDVSCEVEEENAATEEENAVTEEAEASKESAEDEEKEEDPMDDADGKDEKGKNVSLLKLGGLFTGPKFFTTLSIINLSFCVIFGMFDFFLTCFDFARGFAEFEGNEQIADLFSKFQYTYDGTASTFIVVVMVCVVIAILFLITRKGNRIVNLATVSLAAVYLCIIALTFFIGLVAEVIPYLFDYLRSGGIIA